MISNFMRLGLTMAIAAVCNIAPMQVSAQQWVEMMQNGENIYEVEEAFNAYWEGKTPQKGQGHKQFLRWKAFWEPRLYPSGDFSTLDTRSYFKQIEESQSNQMRDGGDWTEMGLDDWSSISYAPGNGRINIIEVDPLDPNTYYVGTPAGGIWKGTGTSDWIPLSDNLPTLGVSGIVVTDSDPQKIFIGTGDSDGFDTYSMGVLVSEDGGESWQTSGLTFDLESNVRCHMLKAKPGDYSVMFFASTSGLYKSVNGGATWYKVVNANIRDIEFKPGDPEIMYGGSDRFWKSTDGGENWEQEVNQLPGPVGIERVSVAVSADQPEYVYALYANSDSQAFEGLYRSTDSGENWELRSDSPNILAGDDEGNGSTGQAWYDMELAADHDNAQRVLVGGINVWESSNGGSSWTLNADWTWPNGGGIGYVHADLHHMEFQNGQLLIGSDGGIFRSTNSGNTYADLSPGLGISQFYRLGSYAGDSEIVSCGAQDNGTNLRNEGWTHILGADGMETYIHPEDPDIIWASWQYGAMQKTTNAGQDWSWAASGIEKDGIWTTPFIMSPVNPDVFYAGYENIWRSTDGADSWIQISDFSGTNFVALAMGMIDPNTVYAATSGTLYKTNDGGDNWENIDNGLPGQSITYLAVDPLDVDRVWVSFSGFSANNKVFYTSDGGENWENISGGLPNVPVNTIVYDSNTESGVYVGTDTGVYYRSENLADWEPYMNGLPNVIVNELEIHYEDEKLLAATFGRGLWSSSLWETPTETPEAGVSLSDAYICVGNSIEIADVSSGNAPGWSWTFEGGDPVASDQPINMVTYNSPGSFDITLSVSNAAGTTDYTCTDCVVVYDTIGTTLPLVEGFEGVTNFSELALYKLDDENGVGWEVTDGASFSGSQSVWIENYTLDFENVYEMITEPYDLSQIPTGENVYVSFKHAYTRLDGDNTERLRLYLTKNCGETWGLKEQWNSDEFNTAPDALTSFIPTSAAEWEQKIYEVSPDDLESSVAFKFWFRSGNGNNVFIDDINIWSAVTSVGEIESIQELVVYPNPAHSEVNLLIETIKAEQVQLMVTDISGRLVYSDQLVLNLGKSIEQISTNNLGAGMYHLTLVGQDGKTTRTLVVE